MSLCYLIFHASIEHNIDSFYRLLGWDLGTLRPFNPRIAELKYLKTVCGCYSCALGFGSNSGECLSPSCLGVGEHCGTCCFDIYMEFGLTKQTTYEERTLEQIEAAIERGSLKGLGVGDFCGCGQSGSIQEKIVLLSNLATSAAPLDSQCFDVICNYPNGTCCFGCFEIPIFQCRLQTIHSLSLSLTHILFLFRYLNFLFVLNLKNS